MFQKYHALPVQESIHLNVTQIPRHCRTNDGHVLVVARVTYTANFYETPTEQLSEVLKTNICTCGKN